MTRLLTRKAGLARLVPSRFHITTSSAMVGLFLLVSACTSGTPTSAPKPVAVPGDEAAGTIDIARGRDTAPRPGREAPLNPFSTVLPTDVNMFAGSNNAGVDDFETTAVAIAPNTNTACPDGRVIVASGSRLAKGTGSELFPLVDKVGATKGPKLIQPVLLAYDRVAPSPSAGSSSSSVPSASTGSKVTLIPLPTPAPVDDYHIVTSDNHLVRKANGDLLLVWGVVTKAVPADGQGNAAYKQWKDYNGGWRGAFLVWRSTDCGESWGSPADPQPPSLPAVVADATQISVKGTAKSGKGECSYPQGEQQAPWFGGYDMEWIHADPWNANLVYMAVSCDSGNATRGSAAAFPGHGMYTTLLFTSKDGGASFSLSPVDINDVGKTVPVAMTSQPANAHHKNGRLFMFHCAGPKNAPQLSWSDDNGASISAPIDVYYGDAAKPEYQCGNKAQENLPGGGFRNSGGRSISRAYSDDGIDRVRVAYPAVENGHQVERVALVSIDSKDHATVKPMVTIAPEDQSNGDVLYATFIESDRVGISKDAPDDTTAVLYWIETGTPKGNTGTTTPSKVVGIFAGYRVVLHTADSSGGRWERQGDLSVTSGIRRYWVPNAKEFFGDYVKGGFFRGGSPGSLNFVAQWPERSAPQAPRSVHFNVVTVIP